MKKFLVLLCIMFLSLLCLTLVAGVAVWASTPASPGDFFAQLKAVVDGPKLSTLVAYILAIVVLGIIAAVKTNTFRLSALTDFLKSKVLYLVMGYFGVGVIAVFDPQWLPLVSVTWAALLATLTGQAAMICKELGWNLPDWLANPKPTT